MTFEGGLNVTTFSVFCSLNYSPRRYALLVKVTTVSFLFIKLLAWKLSVTVDRGKTGKNESR